MAGFFSFAPLVPLALLLLHCGGNASPGQAGGTTSGPGGATASSTATATGSGGASVAASSSTGTGGGAPLCPAEAPTLGGACDVPGSVGQPPCTYGAEPLAECREAFACADGLWAHATGAFGPCPASSAGCPTEPMDGADCTGAAGAPCSYPDGTICACGTFAGPIWSCYTPSGGCPVLLPNAGTACGMEGLNCSYEGCNLEVSCMSGAWRWLHAAC